MLVLLLAVPLTVTGGDARPPIVTDRPSISDTSLTVPGGSLQVETGAEFGSDSVGVFDGSSMGFPTKLRYGVIEDFEVHAEGTVYDRFTVEGPAGELTASGFSDLELGGKAHLLDGNGAIPSVGVLAAIRLPVGADEVSGDLLVFRPTVAAEWSLVPALSLFTNVGLTVPLEDRELFTDGFRYTAGLGFAPAALAGFTFFAELFGQIPLGDGEEVTAADAGALFLVNDDFQLDVYARVGLNDAAQDLIVGGGGSFRF